MKRKVGLDRDPYFNTYDPNYKDPLWKATIKKILGWEKSQQDKNAIVDSNVMINYRNNVQFDTTAADAIKISVTHRDPQKASEYANKFMVEMRHLVKSESILLKNCVSTIYRTLADALQEMEQAQKIRSML